MSKDVYRLLTPGGLAGQFTYSPRLRFAEVGAMLNGGVRCFKFEDATKCVFGQAHVRVFPSDLPVSFKGAFARVCFTGRNERRVQDLRIGVVVQTVRINQRCYSVIDSMLRIVALARLSPNCLDCHVEFVHVFREQDRRTVLQRQLQDVSQVGADASRGRGFLCIVRVEDVGRVILGRGVLMGGIDPMTTIYRGPSSVNYYRRRVFQLLYNGRVVGNLLVNRVRFHVHARSGIHMAFYLRVLRGDEASRSPVTYCGCFAVLVRSLFLSGSTSVIRANSSASRQRLTSAILRQSGRSSGRLLPDGLFSALIISLSPRQE